MTSEIIFYSSKRKIKFLIFACVLICFLGFFIIMGMENWEILFLHVIPFNKLFLGSTLILIFTVFIILLQRRLRSNKPQIIINNTTIFDQSSYTSVGEIEIVDITEINSINIKGQNLILLKVKNPEKYIERQNSTVKRKILEASYKNNGTPIILSASSLECSFDELYSSIQSRIRI